MSPPPLLARPSRHSSLLRRSGLAALAEAEAAKLVAAAAAGPAVRAGIATAPAKSDAQVAETTEHLDELESLARDKVELVRITTDFAEGQRRLELDGARAARLGRLREDESVTQTALAALAEKFAAAGGQGQAEELKASLEALQAACAAVLAQKDALVAEFRAELKQKDDTFVKSLRDHAQDVQSMLDYIADHTKTLWDEYRLQLETVEGVFMEERTDLLAATRKVGASRLCLRVVSPPHSGGDGLTFGRAGLGGAHGEAAAARGGADARGAGPRGRPRAPDRPPALAGHGGVPPCPQPPGAGH